jgi:hypothetical protein
VEFAVDKIFAEAIGRLTRLCIWNILFTERVHFLREGNHKKGSSFFLYSPCRVPPNISLSQESGGIFSCPFDYKRRWCLNKISSVTLDSKIIIATSLSYTKILATRRRR